MGVVDRVSLREHDDVGVTRRRAATFGVRPDDPTFGELLRAFVRRYGWRAYALPVLAVITVVALATTTGGGKHGAASTHTRAAGGSGVGPPTAVASIALKSDQPGPNAQNTVLPSDALPSGAPYTTQGTGTFRVLAGTSKVIGRVTAATAVRRYDIEVENGITGIDLAGFANTVQSVLSDPRSWAGHDNVALQRVSSGHIDFHITLTSSMTVRKICGYDVPIETSCFLPAGSAQGVNRVVLNNARWVRGDPAYVGDLASYRIYMINHEDGHALGHQHAHQCLSDGLAPVMMQQTIGLRSAVSGALCQANPWPYPTGATDAPGTEQADTPQNSEFQLPND